ncbi:acyltransferase family protein [Ovoidimarina sediminis]|uniref:acyltransferase family protein n=1 Tax=Ovoidimarina sediminis TaxID=3079856 RepID=UPI00290CD3B1|nr:acyltransferase [Rhodophyticola sp. MJ-SS7]MDU8946239.1 acyltransferase [Rhodophyticola sp. MJ-SS7]
MIEKAREAARQTPASRNRAADCYRTIAILFVVLGHWILVAPYAPEGQLALRNILAEQHWTQYLTWLFQVMPVFFFVGGFSNAASWSSARRSSEKSQAWATKRLSRLLIPVVPLIIVWALAAAIAFGLGVDPDLARDASRAALIPVWFLAVYIMVTLVVPITFALWERIGLWSVAGLAVLAIVIDVVGVGAGVQWLRWANYAPVWLAVHQLGYWWWRSDQNLRSIVALCVIGVVWLAILVGPAGYPLSMVSVPGEEFSNTRPPTTAMLALGAIQIALLLMLAKPVQTWLQGETPWALVILTARNIMTIYLWHLTVVTLVAGFSLLLGGFGLRIEPGTGAWWLFRPIWVAVLIGGLLPFIAIFGRLEAGSRSRKKANAGKLQTYSGTLLSCAGLTILALNGVSMDRAPGINWVPVLLTVVGVILATGEIPRGRKKQ